MGVLLDTGYMPDLGLVSIPGAPSHLVPSFPNNDIPSQVQRDPLGRKRRLGVSQCRGRQRA